MTAREFVSDLFKNGVPGLFAAILEFLKLLVGTGLGHEGWEPAVQRSASFFGALLSLSIVYLYARKTRKKKLSIARIFGILLVLFLVFDVASRFAALNLARHDPWINLIRDNLWPTVYFGLCICVVGFVASLGLLIPRDDNQGPGTGNSP